MVRGTTARFKFTLPYMKSELQWVTIKFWQPGNVGTTRAPLPIIKELTHCDSPEGSTELYVSLTAEETSRFSDRLKAKVQLRARHQGGTVIGTRAKLIPVYEMDDDILNNNHEWPIEQDEWVVLDGDVIVEQR